MRDAVLLTQPDESGLVRNVQLRHAIDTACGRVAPLWPLKHFVAVNPFLGFVDRSFHSTCASLHRIARIDMLMPRSFYRDALDRGEIDDADVRAVLNALPKEWNAPRTVAAFRQAVESEIKARSKHPAHVPTVAEVLDSLADGDRLASGTSFMVDEISRFCAAYFDQGQASWRLPARTLPLYASWRQSIQDDRNAEAMGIRNFRRLVERLPTEPVAAIAATVDLQSVPQGALADYFHQALLTVGGWAAHARYLRWNRELRGEQDETLVHVLAIRLSFGYALFAQRTDAAFRHAWRSALELAAVPAIDERLGDDADLCIDLLAHEAYEHAFQRRIVTRLQQRNGAPCSLPNERPPVQAAFCIDVRSEIYRRAFESEYSQVQTLGFAGFFGFPIEYVPLGHHAGGAQCPVLLRPTHAVCETVRGASTQECARIERKRLLRQRAAKAWKAFKTAAVSSFVFVESCGLLFAPKLVTDNLALTRPVRDPDIDGLDRSAVRFLGPRIDAGSLDGRTTAFTEQQKVEMAAAVLRGMSLTANFAPMVLLVGHGSTTVNNPYASGLDCGACGGYTGEANARVAALILNDALVRASLRACDIHISDDTWFVAALHDTATDDIRIFDTDDFPLTHHKQMHDLRSVLARASSRARRERAGLLGIPDGSHIDRAIRARSRDWSQVRPEWALARNAAFIAAPRSRTRGINLEGRAFLHEYNWRNDQGFAVLELIMTAPLIVASWINLQYYGSTVNNPVFGSGNKTLHNVTGVLGVFEGNAGDLKIGLPWQSVHDGTRYVHEPIRLNAFIEAPLEALDTLLARHDPVRQLVENRWIHLFRIDENGEISHRHQGSLGWMPLRLQGEI